MSKYVDNVSTKDLAILKDIPLKTLNSIYNYFKINTNLNNENIIYIMDLILDSNFKDYSTSYLEESLLNKYNKNKTVLFKHCYGIKYADNIEELLSLISKNNSYALFEEINNSNIDFYSVLWEVIHS